MRVALVAHLTEISGAGIALVNIARGLGDAGFDVVVVFPGHGPLQELAHSHRLRQLVLPNPQVSVAAASALERVALMKRRAGYVLRLAAWMRHTQVDLVYVNTTASVFPGMAARLAGKPVIWHVHENIERPSRSVRAKMRIIESVAAAVLYASESARDLFPAKRVPKHLVVKNPINVRAFAERATGRQRLVTRPPRIVMNGLFPRKAPDLFIRAASIVVKRLGPNAQFVIVGATAEDQRDYVARMKTLANEMGLAGVLEFAGFAADMPGLLAEADVFVSSSRNEATPIAIIEAMASGVSVVTTSVGDCALTVGNGEMGWVVPPEDPDALADAIEQVIANPDLARRKASLAQRHVLSEYTSSDFAEPLHQLLRDVAAHRGE